MKSWKKEELIETSIGTIEMMMERYGNANVSYEKRIRLDGNRLIEDGLTYTIAFSPEPFQSSDDFQKFLDEIRNKS